MTDTKSDTFYAAACSAALHLAEAFEGKDLNASEVEKVARALDLSSLPPLCAPRLALNALRCLAISVARHPEAKTAGTEKPVIAALLEASRAEVARVEAEHTARHVAKLRAAVAEIRADVAQKEAASAAAVAASI